MSENSFRESLEKSINYMTLGISDINEFGEIYNETVRMNKLQSLIDGMTIENNKNVIQTGGINKNISDSELDNLFFRELKSKVNPIET